MLGAIGQRALWLDRPGSASRLKLVVSTWMVALTTGAAEALALAQGLGVDPGLFLEAVAGGPLDCAYLHDKVPAILDRNFSPSFTVELACGSPGWSARLPPRWASGWTRSRPRPSGSAGPRRPGMAPRT